jgi:hypothetical protein
MILSSVTVPLKPPFKTDAIPGTLFDLVSSMSLNSSTCSISQKFTTSPDFNPYVRSSGVHFTGIEKYSSPLTSSETKSIIILIKSPRS